MEICKISTFSFTSNTYPYAGFKSFFSFKTHPLGRLNEMKIMYGIVYKEKNNLK